MAREPFFKLDLVGREYIENEATGGQMTMVQRGVFLELLKEPAPLARYAGEGSTDSELASIFDLPSTAIEVFGSVLAESRALLAHRIRSQMLRSGENGNSDALAYLARTYLGDTPK